MVLLGENAGIVVEGIFPFLDILTPNLISRLPNYCVEPNFLNNKVKNRGKFLFTTCLHGTNMGISSPKGNRIPTHITKLCIPKQIIRFS
jgi:hypothetical protein